MNAARAQEDAEYDATDASQRLKRCAWIAIRFGFDVKPVDKLVKLLMPERAPPWSKGDALADDAAIEDLKTLVEELRPLFERLKAFDEEHGLSLLNLAAASPLDRIESLRSFRKTLDKAASASWQAYARKDEADARRAILLAKMGTAAQWWFEYTGDWPTGAFELSDGAVFPRPDTAVEFVHEALIAAGCDYSAEEVSEYVEDMQRSTGMFKYLESAKYDPSLHQDWMVEFGLAKPISSHLKLVASN